MLQYVTQERIDLCFEFELSYATLGAVNDHATALTLFGQWLSKSEAVAERAFLEGLVLAEQQATADLRAAFLATWTPKDIDRLKRQFGAYC